MRRAISLLAFSIFTVLAMTSEVVTQRIDGIGQQAIAGPHMPVVPMTVN